MLGCFSSAPRRLDLQVSGTLTPLREGADRHARTRRRSAGQSAKSEVIGAGEWRSKDVIIEVLSARVGVEFYSFFFFFFPLLSENGCALLPAQLINCKLACVQ